MSDKVTGAKVVILLQPDGFDILGKVGVIFLKGGRRGWSLPGGTPEEGESPKEALIRELKEELPNLKLSERAIECMRVWKHYKKDGYNTAVFRLQGPAKLASGLVPAAEIQKIAIVPLEEAANFTDYWKSFFEYYKDEMLK